MDLTRAAWSGILGPAPRHRGLLRLADLPHRGEPFQLLSNAPNTSTFDSRHLAHPRRDRLPRHPFPHPLRQIRLPDRAGGQTAGSMTPACCSSSTTGLAYGWSCSP
ncbi:MAG: hypothetical protein M0C28_33805 [Candidatus Moduliflexus flocculans]|nr:hypothetical protein [Candidatus Moduliflexus flocculans]